jgi:hypothetical protein
VLLNRPWDHSSASNTVSPKLAFSRFPRPIGAIFAVIGFVFFRGDSGSIEEASRCRAPVTVELVGVQLQAGFNLVCWWCLVGRSVIFDSGPRIALA